MGCHENSDLRPQKNSNSGMSRKLRLSITVDTSLIPFLPDGHHNLKVDDRKNLGIKLSSFGMLLTLGVQRCAGHSRAFDMHAVSHQNITTKRVLLEKKQIGSSVKDRNKL